MPDGHIAHALFRGNESSYKNPEASASFAPCIIHLNFLLSKRSKYKKENPTNLIRKEIVITRHQREKNQVVEQDLLYGSPVSSKLCIELH